MKTIEDRAHEILLKLIETDKTGFDAEGIASYSYEIAKAMQAEADKLKPQQEFKVDWSQAPEWANWWSMDEDMSAYWHSCVDSPFTHNEYFMTGNPNGHTFDAPSFNYQGDWKDSLRGRP